MLLRFRPAPVCQSLECPSVFGGDRADGVAREVFVLGGDIFDFRWSRIPILRAVQMAATWLRELAASCPQCHFHLVLGNHDYHQALIDRLVELEKEVSNLSWHRYYVRLGSSVFLHGDVADKTMNAQGWPRPARNGSTAVGAARS